MYETWFTSEIEDEAVRQIYAEEICARGGFPVTIEYGMSARHITDCAVEEDNFCD